MTLHRYTAICPKEIQTTVAQELVALGAENVTEGFKAVHFTADLETAYRTNLWCRTASRILMTLREGAGSSLPIIKSQASRVPWSDIFLPTSTYLIEGVVGDRGPEAPTSNDLSKAIREGLEDYFTRKNLKKPTVNLKEPQIVVVAFLYQKKLTISLDISGKSLHKRGYRLEGHPAPIKETLASAILTLAGYDGSQPLYDPMCGSGTIVIEGCYKALHKAPLIHRKKGDFGFEWIKGFDRSLWRQVQETARKEKTDEIAAPIFASDISEEFVTMARQNALRARVEKFINFESRDFIDSTPPSTHGILVTNLPYGERLNKGSSDELKEFFQKIGNTLKRNYAGWRAALLAAEDSPYKFIGLRPSRRIPIMNGSISCRLLIFDLYAGKKHEGETNR